MLYSALSNKNKNIIRENTYLDILTLIRISMFELNTDSEDVFIESRDLELLLRFFGKAAIWKYKDKWIASECSFANNPDVYFEGKDLIVTIPGETRTFKDWKNSDEVFVVFNNSLMLPDTIIDMIASELTEINKSILTATINTRFTKILESPNSNMTNAIKTVLEKVKAGIPDVVTSNLDIEKSLNAISISEANDGKIINELLSNHENISKRFYSFFGLNMIDGDKKAQMNEDEINNGSSAALVIPYDMLSNRKKAFERMYEKTGIKINVDFSKCWEHEEDRLIVEKEDMDKETEKREEKEEKKESESNE